MRGLPKRISRRSPAVPRQPRSASAGRMDDGTPQDPWPDWGGTIPGRLCEATVTPRPTGSLPTTVPTPETAPLRGQNRTS